MISDLDKLQAYKIVYDDLMRINMFKGIYDASHTEDDSTDDFMDGISTVMEYIAAQVSDETYTEYRDIWIKHIMESIAKAKQREHEDSDSDEYVPLCPFGATDCVCDPAYIHYAHPEWYKSMYGDKTPEEVANETCATKGDRFPHCYDDEDK